MCGRQKERMREAGWSLREPTSTNGRYLFIAEKGKKQIARSYMHGDASYEQAVRLVHAEVMRIEQSEGGDE